MATHSSLLAWRIPWTEEPGGLQSAGLRRVGHSWALSACTPSYPQALCPQIQPTTSRKYLEKKSESSKRQNLNLLCTGIYLHSIYDALGNA